MGDGAEACGFRAVLNRFSLLRLILNPKLSAFI
jgi:hypothetical protein